MTENSNPNDKENDAVNKAPVSLAQPCGAPSEQPDAEPRKSNKVRETVAKVGGHLGQHHNAWMVVLTGLAAIFSFGALWQASGQLSEMRKQSAGMAKDFQTQQRAWVGCIDHQDGRSPHDLPDYFKLVFKNTGPTPAQKIRGAIHVAIEPPGTRVEAIKKTNTGTIPSESTLFPQSTMVLSVYLPELANHADREVREDAISNGTMVIYVWAEVTYSDIFGGDHVSQCAFRFDTNLHALVGLDHYNKAD